MKKKILSEIILTILLMLASTVISFAFFQFGNKNIANITVIYSLALILTALGTTGYWYGIAASLYCVTAVNYFFSYPYFHFNFSLDGYPITFINKPVGATCTIIAELYRQSHTPMKSEIASILLCGILADTLALQSATTTAEDRSMAQYLADITNLDAGTLGREVLSAASKISGRSAREIISQDMKIYNENGFQFSVSQIEVENPAEITGRKAEFVEILDDERAKNGRLFAALLVTDIIRLSSLLVISAPADFLQTLTLPQQEDNVYYMKDIVSRKKQLMPILSEILENYGRQP